MNKNERRIIYLPCFVVIVLTILLGLSNNQSYSLVAVLFIIIAIGNIVYFYWKMSKP